jgi:hypothetical protein
MNSLLLLLLLLLLLITFVEDIYNYVPETNHVSTVHSFAGILWLKYTVHVPLFPTINVLQLYIIIYIIIIIIILYQLYAGELIVYACNKPHF